MEFIGRATEIRALEEIYDSPASGFLPVYGRRRVGKTALIRQFMRGRPGVFLSGKRAPARLQIEELLREAAAVLEDPVLARLPVLSWKEALCAVVDAWRGDEKLVLSLDEFQWLAEASPELPSVLQECWDHHWKKSGRVMLVLCGSYVGFLEREVLGRKSPLYGRRTGQIQLRPFGYREAGHFHPGYGPTERAKAWFLCGGIPFYLEQFDPARSVETNLARCFLREHGVFFREPELLLREELREVEKYHAVLVGVAEAGRVTAGRLGERTGLSQKVQYYLKQLTELGYIRRTAPLTCARPKRTDQRYELADPLLRFWFRFVSPNQSASQRYGHQEVFRERVKPNLPNYFGACFETLCLEALPDLQRREEIGGISTLGSYWSREVEIDVVARREDGWIELGECKWGAVRSAKALVRELEAKAAAYPNPENAPILLRAFTRTPVRQPASGALPIRWHSLDELYAEGA